MQKKVIIMGVILLTAVAVAGYFTGYKTVYDRMKPDWYGGERK